MQYRRHRQPARNLSFISVQAVKHHVYFAWGKIYYLNRLQSPSLSNNRVLQEKRYNAKGHVPGNLK